MMEVSLKKESPITYSNGKRLFTIDQKVDALVRIKMTGCSKAEVARSLHVAESTFRGWFKNKDIVMKAEAKYNELKTKSTSSSDGYKSDDNHSKRSFSVESDNNSSTCYTDDREGSRSRFSSPDTCAAPAVVRRSPDQHQHTNITIPQIQQQQQQLQLQQQQQQLTNNTHLAAAAAAHHHISSLGLSGASAAAAVAAAAAAAAAAAEHPGLRLSPADLHSKINSYFSPAPLSASRPPVSDIFLPPAYAVDNSCYNKSSFINTMVTATLMEPQALDLSTHSRNKCKDSLPPLTACTQATQTSPKIVRHNFYRNLYKPYASRCMQEEKV